MTQNKLTLMLLMTGILAMMIPTSAPFAMANGGFICDDSMGGMAAYVSGDVFVPAGKLCFITGTTVTGSVTVEGQVFITGTATVTESVTGEGASFIIIRDSTIGKDVEGKEVDSVVTTVISITNSRIGNDVKNKGGGTITISTGSHIGENVQSEEAGAVRIFDSHIGGSIQISKSTGAIDIQRNNIGTIFGNVQIIEHDRGFIRIISNIMPDGNIQIEKSKRLTSIFVDNNDIEHGNIQLVEDQANRIIVNFNELDDGDVQIFKNDGRFFVFLNDMGGKLQCKENTIPDGGSMAGGGNTAAEAEDQCAGFLV